MPDQGVILRFVETTVPLPAVPVGALLRFFSKICVFFFKYLETK
jgi:hypothetical protein